MFRLNALGYSRVFPSEKQSKPYNRYGDVSIAAGNNLLRQELSAQAAVLAEYERGALV